MIGIYFKQDCHGTGGEHTIPVQDDTQNVIAEEGYQNGTHTQIQFRRPLETCDPHDVTITVNKIKFIIGPIRQEVSEFSHELICQCSVIYKNKRSKCFN